MDIENKVSKLEKDLERMRRRSFKVAKAIIPPIPISAGVKASIIEDAILRYMFPCGGKITRGIARLRAIPKGEIELAVTIQGDDHAIAKKFTLQRRVNMVDMDVDVVAGDCLEVTLLQGSTDLVTEIWVSLLWAPVLSDFSVKKFLIDELEEGMKELKNASEI